MAPKIFILGMTGYVGGQFTQDLVAQHPDFQITGLVRTQEQAEKIRARWPHVQIVIGDLESHDILVEEATKAEVVLQLADADHTQSAISLIQGLSRGKKNGAYIHLSGAAGIIDSSTGFGEPSARVWNDISDLREVTSFPATTIHAVTEQTVIGEGKAHGVRTAIVSPANIFGEGKGPLKTKSMQFPWYVEAVLKRGNAFTVGEGKNVCSSVHVRDLADALVLIVEEALRGETGTATWGADGLYYVESAEFVWDDVVAAIADEGVKKGLLKSAIVDRLSAEDATALHPWATMVWGSNCRIEAKRLRKLGWKPSKLRVLDTVKELI